MNRKILSVFALSIAALLVVASGALAAETLFGSATLVQESGTDYAVSVPTSGGVEFDDLTGQTINDLSNLTIDLLGACGTGSPRFAVGVQADADVTLEYAFFYLGSAPSYNDCNAATYQTWGNLLDATDNVDTSQLGGTFYDTVANLKATWGGLAIQELFVVSDGYTPVTFDNAVINGTTYTFDQEVEETPPPPVFTKDDCKDGGWRDFTGNGEPGPFRNQGQCVSFFVSNRGGNG